MKTSSVEKVSRLREDLRLAQGDVAVNAGTWGPLCRASHEAMRAFAEEARGNRIDSEAFVPRVLGLLGKDREAVARFLGCSPQEIALAESTTAALNIFLWGMPLQAGDEIVQGGSENPAAQVPLWVISRHKKLQRVTAPSAHTRRGATEAVLEAISPRTRLVLVSHVNYTTGAQVDLRAISQRAHAVGARVLVDGVQAAGTVPIDVRASDVDGYALARHKFLCGPDGAGALYLRHELLDEIAVTFSGACSDSAHGMSGELRLQPNAERFELSTRSIDAYVGGTAALGWFEQEVGREFAYQRCTELRTRLWDRLTSLGRLHLVGEREQGGALLAFHVDGVPAAEVVSVLRSRRILSRTLSALVPEAVRLSIGWWTRDDDLEQIARVLTELARSKAADRSHVRQAGGD